MLVGVARWKIVQCGFSPLPDVPMWLKSLRLHKYQSLFSDLSYREMLSLRDEDLETRVSCCESSAFSSPGVSTV